MPTAFVAFEGECTIGENILRHRLLVWSGDGHAERQDHVAKGQIDVLQHSRFSFAKTDVEQRTWGKYVEPMIITTVLGSLVYLFFSNR